MAIWVKRASRAIQDGTKVGSDAASVGAAVITSEARRTMQARGPIVGEMPAGLTSDPVAFDAWFEVKVQEALNDPRPSVSLEDAMTKAKAIIDKNRATKSSQTGGLS